MDEQMQGRKGGKKEEQMGKQTDGQRDGWVRG